MSRLNTLTKAVQKDVGDGLHSLNMLFALKNAKKRQALAYLFIGNRVKSSTVLRGIQVL